MEFYIQGFDYETPEELFDYTPDYGEPPQPEPYEEIEGAMQSFDEYLNAALAKLYEADEAQAHLEDLMRAMDGRRKMAFEAIINLIESELNRYEPVDDGRDSPNSPYGGVY